MSGPHAHPGTRAVVAPQADDRTVVAPEADEAESPPAVPDDASDDPFAMGPPWTDGRNRETEGAEQIPSLGVGAATEWSLSPAGDN